MELDPDEGNCLLKEELKDVSLEELQRLGQTVGRKKYQDVIFNKKVTKDDTPKTFKRENKNRPRECSSKIRNPHNVNLNFKSQQPRDPRFDSLCGPYNAKAFKKAYKFIDTIRNKEKCELERLAMSENDPKKLEKIQFLLQRYKNQEREKKKEEAKEVKKIEEVQKKTKLLQEGKKPHFQTKSEKKLSNLLEKYEELKQEGKLQKHLKKKNKKKKVPKF